MDIGETVQVGAKRWGVVFHISGPVVYVALDTELIKYGVPFQCIAFRQEPWQVIDASTDGLLTIYYPERNEQRVIRVPDAIHEQHSGANFDSSYRLTKTMPLWAMFW